VFLFIEIVRRWKLSVPLIRTQLQFQHVYEGKKIDLHNMNSSMLGLYVFWRENFTTFLADVWMVDNFMLNFCSCRILYNKTKHFILFCLFVCLFVYSRGLAARAIFQPSGAVTITGAYSVALVVFSQWGFLYVPHLLPHRLGI
jgi:hypothetical protein